MWPFEAFAANINNGRRAEHVKWWGRSIVRRIILTSWAFAFAVQKAVERRGEVVGGCEIRAVSPHVGCVAVGVHLAKWHGPKT